MIGFAIAAPIGPIGLLCIKKTLELGFKGALLVGLGASLADGLYALFAALGLSAISSILLDKTPIIKLIGGLFLLYLAYKEARNVSSGSEAQVKNKTPLKVVGEVFFLTLTNPMTILSFISVFASMSSGPTSLGQSVLMVLGVFSGSMAWWCILGGGVMAIKDEIPPVWLGRIKWISCFVLAAFGLFSIFDSVRNWYK